MPPTRRTRWIGILLSLGTLPVPGAGGALLGTSAPSTPPTVPPSVGGAGVPRGAEVLAGPFPNLVYGMTTLARLTFADPADFRTPLRSHLKVTDAEIGRWTAALASASRPPAPPRGALPSPWGVEDPQARLLAALLGARDPADLDTRLAPLLPEPRRRVLQEILARHLPGYRRWWTETVGDIFEAKGRAVRDVLRRQHLGAGDRRVARFLGLAAPDLSRTRILLVAYPTSTWRGNGVAYHRTGVVDAGSEDPAEELAVIAAHELLHRHFALMPRPRAQRLLGRLMAWEGWSDLAHVNLFEESLTTALSAILTRDRNPRLYDDPYIDACARAFRRVLRKPFEQGARLLDGDLLERSLAAARRALGPRAAAAAPPLRSVEIGFGDATLADLARSTPWTILAQQSWMAGPGEPLEQLQRYPKLSGLLLVTSRSWGSLPRWKVPHLETFEALRRKHPLGFVGRVPRPAFSAHEE